MVNTPYGGKLVQNILTEDEKNEFLAKNLKRIVINKDLVTEVKNICNGVYSPLEGFMDQNEVESVVSNMRLLNGLVWSIPIVLDIDKLASEKVQKGDKILLVDMLDHAVAVMEVSDKFSYDKHKYCKSVFGTDDELHPGVYMVGNKGDVFLGGKVSLIQNTCELFPELNFTPAIVRDSFKENGWKTIVAFQTRNPPHRGHEYLQKCSLEVVDGLFINPVIGKKKSGDFKDALIIKAYQKALDITIHQIEYF